MKVIALMLALTSLACVLSAVVVPSLPVSTEAVPMAVTVPVVSTEEAVPMAVIVPAESCAVVTAETSLHVRSGAGYESAVLGWLLHGEDVRVRYSVSGWTLITTMDGVNGWVKSDYLRGKECEK